MSVNVTSNFLLNSRGFTLTDGGGITWTINKATNAITATTGSGGGLSGANPTAAVGLTAVNGSAVSYMRSDGAPAIDQTMTPTMSGLWKFTGGITVTGAITLDTFTFSVTGNATISGTNTGDQVIPVGANPSGSAGLSAVNGSATSFLRSDSAPPISQAIVPTWSGAHTFSARALFTAGISLNGATTFGLLAVESSTANIAGGAAWTNGYSTFGPNVGSSTGAALGLGYDTVNNSAVILSLAPNTAWETLTIGAQSLVLNTNAGGLAATIGANATFSGGLGLRGNAAAAQSTGWGTPTGPAVVASFSGTAATTAQIQAALAQIITVLKSVGILGA